MAGEAQVGSAVGTAVGSIWGPVGAAVGGAIGGAIGSAAAAPDSKGGAAAGGGPVFTDASSSTYGTSIGNDNWTVNFGDGNSNTPTATKTTTTQIDDRQQLGQPDPFAFAVQGASVLPTSEGGRLALLAAGAFVLFRLLRKRRG